MRTAWAVVWEWVGRTAYWVGEGVHCYLLFILCALVLSILLWFLIYIPTGLWAGSALAWTVFFSRFTHLSGFTPGYTFKQPSLAYYVSLSPPWNYWHFGLDSSLCRSLSYAYRLFSSISGFYLLDPICIFHIMITKNVSRDCPEFGTIDI